jgi:adenylate cyclase
MGANTTDRKLAAILSADVVGYSRLMAEDEAATIRTLTDYREVISTLIRQHRGRVVDSPGDNLLAEFPTALDAVRGAVEIQRVIQARNADLAPDRRMEFRVGVHMGDVTVEGDRFYGDGVNIAARLEGLAAPGGVCVSGTVYEQVEKKLSVELEDLGQHTLKNIARPVHVYGVKLLLAEGEPKRAEKSLPGMEALTVPGFSGQGAVAVLPFDNLSGDPEQEYFADGMVEDLITRLSTMRGFPVIARNSSFTYKGKPVDVKQVSRELGARYLVEGSVRKAGERVRITAQLIDATSGAHVWAERYDRDLRDIFALQDEITEAIVASVYPEVAKAEQERAARLEPQDLTVWECINRGLWHLWDFSEEGTKKAKPLFERAVELEPRSAVAVGGLAQAYYNELVLQLIDSSAEHLAELLQLVQRCVALDDRYPEGQWLLGVTNRITGHSEKAIAALERAIELNPSYTLAHHELGVTLSMLGRPQEAFASAEKAMRLSPRDPMMFLFLFGVSFAHATAERWEDAIDWAQRSLERRSDSILSHLVLAASCGWLGRTREAREAVEQMLRLSPHASLGGTRLQLSGADPAVAERLIEGLRRAGLKE